MTDNEENEANIKLIEKKNTSLITEELFREAYQYTDVKKPPLKKRIANALKCSKDTALNVFPVAKWLPKYGIKTDLLSDIIAGATVAVMHIPHGLAYAPLGRVEPVVGFYMAVFPVFIYMLLGTSRHISIGTFAVVCAMVGQIVSEYSPDPSEHLVVANSTNSTSPQDTLEPITVGSTVCLLVGLWEAALGLLKMGSLTVIMSESLVSGFTTGAAFHVFSYQLKNLFGVPVASFSGLLKLLFIYIDFFKKIESVNLVSMSISICCISILLFFNLYLNRLLHKKFPKNKIPIPTELLVIIIGILVSYFGKLSENYHVRIVGNVPTGFPEPKAPHFSLIPSLLFSSFVVAIVAVAINVSLAKIFAKRDNYVIHNNQELLAYGLANVFASFFQCLPSAASLSRSSVQYSVGGKTQLASLFSIFLIVFILLFAGFIFEPVPYCVLSSIVVVSLQGLMLQLRNLPKIWKQNRWDGFVWLGTFLSVIILDLDVGLAVGVILSIFRLIVTTYSFKINILGRVPNTDIYLDLDHYKSALVIPNVLILQITGNLNFMNSSKLENLILDKFKKFSVSASKDQSYVVLNMSSVTKIDPTSVNVLRTVHAYLKKSNCDLYLASCNLNVYKAFEVCNLFVDIPKEQIVPSVADAVEYLMSVT